jgi:hypothetical protein
MRLPIALALLTLLPPAAAQGPEKEKKAYTAGSLVRRDLALPVLDGPEKPLLIFGPLEEVETPPIVLAWWSLRDPRCRKAETKLHAIADDYAQQGVRVYLVESNHDELVAGIGDPLEKIRKLREDLKHTLPLLLDRGNAVADEFGVRCANEIYVIDHKRKVRYQGSIDDDPDGTREDEAQPYLREALDLALQGRSPEQVLRSPRGRPIKRAPDAGKRAPVKEGGAGGGKAKKR